MIGHDFISLLSADATVAVYLTVLVLLGGAVSGVVALGVMQTGIRANVQREAFLAFFYPPFGDLKNSDAARSIREFADLRGLSLFSLHYRQLAGQLLAIATNESRRAQGDKTSRPLTCAILDLKMGDKPAQREPSLSANSDYKDELSTQNSQPDSTRSSVTPYRDDDELELSARWIDLLQGALGRAVSSKVLWVTASVWWAVLLLICFLSVGNSSSWQSFADGSSSLTRFAGVLGLFFQLVWLPITAALAWAVAAAGLFTFTILDRVVGAR